MASHRPITGSWCHSLGSEASTKNVAIQTAIPMDLEVRLEVAGQQTSVTVEANADNLVENKATVSDTVDRQLLAALPTSSPDSGFNDAIIYTTPGVAADSNGFFHPLGDHAQVSYVDRWATRIGPAQQGIFDIDSGQCHSVDGGHLRLASGRVRG